MKIQHRLAAFALVIAGMVSATGCHKTPQDNRPVNMSATIGSPSFRAMRCESYLDSNLLIIRGKRDIITNTSSEYPMIKLGIWQLKDGPGSYTIGGSDSTTAWYYRSETDFSQAVSGSITVTELTSPASSYAHAFKFTGRFHFVCADGTVVTDGGFNSDLWYAML